MNACSAMIRLFRGCLCVASVLGGFVVSVPAQPLQRVPATQLTLPLSLPQAGYVTSNAFGSLSFTDPVAILTPPGETNRLFVVEQRGRVAVITNLANPNRTVFLDISAGVAGGTPSDERGLLGMAFHPGYETNRTFFLFYTTTGTLYDRLSRFETSATDPNQAVPGSETILINQLDQAGNHNAGDLHFGPDGYLYVSLGDEGGANDSYANSQTITKDFFSGILRLDVDARPGSLPPNPHPATTANYAVPPDNPFVGATSFNGLPVDPAAVRTEFWAVGLRNPWRFSFDPETGRLYCADVGQGNREEIDIITRGGNYGWNYREGTLPFAGSPPPGFVGIDPIHEYAHGSGPNQGNSVTGGVVYRGTGIPALYGAYLFADYVSGNLWALWYDGATVSAVQRLTGNGAIAGFGVDPRNADVLLADQGADTLKRLAYAAGTEPDAGLPPTLADTGAFADLASLTPNPGIVRYELNVPFWSDHARKTRWFSVPDVAQTIGFSPEGHWFFPTGTVWLKHFELELTNGVPESVRRLETRFLVRNALGVYGLTYRWDDTQANATLVPEAGLEETFEIHDGLTIRTQTWHYPGRAQCLMCHTPAGGYALGFNTAQLHREMDYSGTVTNQIAALSQAGYFSEAVTHLNPLRALVPAADDSASLESRVRSYLSANCAQCHHGGVSGSGTWDGRLSTPLSGTRIVRGPLNDSEGDPENRVVTPESSGRSMLLSRISRLGGGRMPPLASTVLDTNAIDLVQAWITNGLAGYESFGDWQIRYFGSTSTPDAAATADPDVDGARNDLEFLTGTNPTNSVEAFQIEARRNQNLFEVRFPQTANRGFEVQSANALTGVGAVLWKPLDVPANRPFFSITNRPQTVADPATNASRFYRVRVYEP